MKHGYLFGVVGLTLSLALAGCASEDASAEEGPAGGESAISLRPFAVCNDGEHKLVVDASKERAKLEKNNEVMMFGELECGKNLDDPSVTLLCLTAPRVADAGFVVTLEKQPGAAAMTAIVQKTTFVGHIPFAELKCESASQASSATKRK